MKPIERLKLQRQVPELLDSVRSTLYYGVEPNVRRYLADHEAMLSRLRSGDLTSFHIIYLEAIAGVNSSDPTYDARLAEMQAAIDSLHVSLKDVLDKMSAIRALNPMLLPNAYPTQAP